MNPPAAAAARFPPLRLPRRLPAIRRPGLTAVLFEVKRGAQVADRRIRIARGKRLSVVRFTSFRLRVTGSQLNWKPAGTGAVHGGEAAAISH